MIASAPTQSYDVICLQMRNYLSRQKEPVKHETMRFIDSVKEIVSNGKEIKPQIDLFIPEIFNFRMIALKWILQQPDIDFLHLLDNSYPSLEALKGNSRLEVLAENVLFALRCNERVAGHILDSHTTSEQLVDEVGTMPDSYNEFFAYIKSSIDNDEAFKVIVAFSHTTLYIEFITLAALIINDEHIELQEQAINELAFLIADAAQTYSAIAKLLGILPAQRRVPHKDMDYRAHSNEEDQLLSDLDLKDFDLNF